MRERRPWDLNENLSHICGIENTHYNRALFMEIAYCNFRDAYKRINRSSSSTRCSFIILNKIKANQDSL